MDLRIKRSSRRRFNGIQPTTSKLQIKVVAHPVMILAISTAIGLTVLPTHQVSATSATGSKYNWSILVYVYTNSSENTWISTTDSTSAYQANANPFADSPAKAISPATRENNIARSRKLYVPLLIVNEAWMGGASLEKAISRATLN